MTILEQNFNEAKVNFTEAYENFITGKVEFVQLIEALKERSQAYEEYIKEKEKA